MVVIDDPKLLRKIEALSDWYGISPTRWAEMQIQRSIDLLTEAIPGLAELIHLT